VTLAVFAPAGLAPWLSQPLAASSQWWAPDAGGPYPWRSLPLAAPALGCRAPAQRGSCPLAVPAVVGFLPMAATDPGGPYLRRPCPWQSPSCLLRPPFPGCLCPRPLLPTAAHDHDGLYPCRSLPLAAPAPGGSCLLRSRSLPITAPGTGIVCPGWPPSFCLWCLLSRVTPASGRSVPSALCVSRSLPIATPGPGVPCPRRLPGGSCLCRPLLCATSLGWPLPLEVPDQCRPQFRCPIHPPVIPPCVLYRTRAFQTPH
jgi:hypothetical protein